MSFSDFLHGRPAQQSDASAVLPRPDGAGESSAASTTSMASDPQFDIFDWHPAYQSCQRYFLDHAQHDGGVQAVAALVNIKLPFQWGSPINGSQIPPYTAVSTYPRSGVHSPHSSGPPVWVSLVPFVRRLVVTGFDKEPILHGFFGDDWRKGVAPVQDVERRNYLFAAKSGGWKCVKKQYDMSSDETVPFLRPLQNVQLVEIEGAEKAWSQWLAMEDWMVGPRAPETIGGSGSGT
ncbi:MAG: hypothetical protein M1821_006202 [Bathelium mastoideum]|nr:MAG: hypothetical protein M1821_006202 [Bathelium mastoideum]KAI9686541.1 MAG: hypothetical protein M1822_003552 [Bathelium mastoideum]